SGNPGPGGWAYIRRRGDEVVEASGGERDTTNNRMELTAVIEGLRSIPESSRVELWSDSQYVLKGLEEWMENWKARGWKTAAKKPVKNVELWKCLDELRRVHTLSFHWIRGHSDHPENERADELAVMARDRFM
ncbi:MAG: ribonuclease HI, partial [Phycisphaerales bacterium]|nr:ribonuclease HI [Phycisphaerales bacterium]